MRLFQLFPLAKFPNDGRVNHTMNTTKAYSIQCVVAKALVVGNLCYHPGTGVHKITKQARLITALLKHDQRAASLVWPYGEQPLTWSVGAALM